MQDVSLDIIIIIIIIIIATTTTTIICCFLYKTELMEALWELLYTMKLYSLIVLSKSRKHSKLICYKFMNVIDDAPFWRFCDILYGPILCNKIPPSASMISCLLARLQWLRLQNVSIVLSVQSGFVTTLY
jgi:hypothetical protein